MVDTNNTIQLLSDKIIYDISLDSGKFISKVNIKLPAEIEKNVKAYIYESNTIYKSDSISLDDIQVEFRVEYFTCGFSQYFAATVLNKSIYKNYRSYINNFDELLYKSVNYSIYRLLVTSAEKLVIDKFGKDAYFNPFNTKTQIDCICDKVRDVLDDNTNNQIIVENFYNTDLTIPVFHRLTIKFDRYECINLKQHDIYKIDIVSAYTDKIVYNHFDTIIGIDELREVLHSIAYNDEGKDL